MLSINIPVYNIEVVNLVLQLQEQAKKLDVNYEIRVYDDGSQPAVKQTNSVIKEYRNVIYVELENNLGRAQIRNKMGFDSKYNYLLFVDADSEITQPNYLQRYLHLAKQNTVLCGGTAYSTARPEKSKMLRWIYGTKREAVSAEIRNSKKGFVITSNNFLIEKRVFEKFPFRKNLKNYGHEDTLLGFDLFKNNLKVEHIDNPVLHTGLENSDVFLAKTRSALQNLKYINDQILKHDSDFIEQVLFLNRYKKISSWIPPFILRFFFQIFSNKLEKHLCENSPRLFWFDVYKLCFYASLK